MSRNVPDRQAPEMPVDEQLVAAIRANMIEMTTALADLDVADVEVELPYRADWSALEDAG